MQMGSHLSHCLPLSVLRSSHVSSSSFAAISIIQKGPHPAELLRSPAQGLATWHSLHDQGPALRKPRTAQTSC